MKKLRDSGGMTWHIVGSYIFSNILAVIATILLTAILASQLTKIDSVSIKGFVEGIQIGLGIEESTLLIQLTMSNIVGMIFTELLAGLLIILIFSKFAGWKKYCVQKNDVPKVIKNTWTIAIVLLLVLLFGRHYNVFAFFLSWGIDLIILLAVTYDSIIGLIIYYVLINKFIKPTLERDAIEETVKSNYEYETIQYNNTANSNRTPKANIVWNIDMIPQYEFGELVAIEKDTDVIAVYINHTKYNEWISYISKLNSVGFKHYDILGENRDADLTLDEEIGQATEQLSNGTYYVSISYFLNELDDEINYNAEILVWNEKPETWQ